MSILKLAKVRNTKTKKEKKEAKLNLYEKIEEVLNIACVEYESNTPDFILAEYLLSCLDAYNKATKKRDKFYGLKRKDIEWK